MKTTLFSLVLLLGMTISFEAADAQISQAYDNEFPRSSAFTISGGTPFTSFAEYAYNLTGGFTIGAIAGIMPKGSGLGISLRGIIFEPSATVRIYAENDALYFPGSKALGGDPWYLLMPSLRAEWYTGSGIHLWGGVGAVITLDTKPAQSMHEMGMGMGEPGMSEMMPMSVGNGICHTFEIGASKNINERISVQAELTTVMYNWSFTTMTDWLQGKPVIASLGMTYAF